MISSKKATRGQLIQPSITDVVGLTASLDSKISLQIQQTTGVVISFTNERVYGSLSTPESGNITADVTGGLLGVTNIIIHQSVTVPTFSSEFKLLSISDNYDITSINYIYCTFISPSEIIYTITKTV